MGRVRKPCNGAGEIDVWWERLDADPDQVASLSALLSPDETARAGRFRHPRHRDRFTVRRGMLRSILGAYLGQNPAMLRFGYGPFGKPALDHGSGTGGLCFSVSHSHGIALYALARGVDVGVDV